MAKDGTMRGGARAGSGRKSKSLVEKLENGNPGGRTLTVMELPGSADLSGADMPEPKSYMKDRQKNGESFDAAEIFEETRDGCGSEAATSWSVLSSSATTPCR